ncbi:MAG TPA: DUF4395 family protein [Thermoleophilaceae bacterium]|nr:DUF4395 family protein [Thermoleophilaceae bacterium]
MARLTDVADPYLDTDVIDSRAPRFNQAVIGSLALVAVAFGVEWLPAVLALQLAVGLTFGRRYCLPCFFYFEVVQPRMGEGRLEDARLPRFANIVGVAFLGGATLAFLAGAGTVGFALTGVVAALALLAASTGLCMGCEAYMWIARLRGLNVERHPADRFDPSDAGLSGDGVRVVQFAGPYCLACREWEAALQDAGVDVAKIDITQAPEVAARYAVRHTPVVLAVDVARGQIVERLTGDPEPSVVARLASL